MTEISVLVADDHLLLRETLVQFLSREPGFRVRSVGSLAETLSRIAADGPYDIVLLDVVMPGMNGLAGIEAAIAANKGGAVVVLSGNVPRSFVDNAVKRGARGFVPKTLPADALAAALRLIASGKVYLPVEHYVEPTSQRPPGLAQLSPQETRVLRFLCKGMSNKEIAREMTLTEITIKTHMRAICSKLGARNRTHAALIGNAHFRD